MLLGISEFLAQACDFVVAHCAEIGITISIPLIIFYICKTIYTSVKNKKAIKNAVTEGTKAIKEEISEFKTSLNERLSTFEANMESKFDAKFVELKEKRKELYNNIYAGIDKIEEKAQETLEKVQEEITEIAQDIVEEVEPIQEVVAELKEETISAEDILR